MFTVTTTLNSFRIRTYKPPPLQPLHNQHLAACLGSVLNKELISPLDSTLTRFRPHNSFRIRTYKKQGGTPPLLFFVTSLFPYFDASSSYSVRYRPLHPLEEEQPPNQHHSHS